MAVLGKFFCLFSFGMFLMLQDRCVAVVIFMQEIKMLV